MGRNHIGHQDMFKIDDAFKSLDEQRSEGLKALKDLQAKKNSALQAEHERLKKKYGSDHPRVKRIATRLAFNESVSSTCSPPV